MREVQLTYKQEEVAPATTSDLVVMSHGKTLKEELSTNVLDKFSREVTVVSSMEKVADGVYDGAYESCVFKGRSLVNAIKNYSRSGYGSLSDSIALLDSGWIRATATSSNNHFELKMDNLNIKPSTKYMYILECRSNTFSGNGQTFQFGDTYKSHVDTPWTAPHIVRELPLGRYTFILTTKSDFSTLNNPVGDRSYICVGNGQIEFRYMILEYQEGMENWNIPFFEGICDVKMPILRNIGKNLLTREYTLNSATLVEETNEYVMTKGTGNIAGGLVFAPNLIPNKTYSFSVTAKTNRTADGAIRVYNDTRKEYINVYLAGLTTQAQKVGGVFTVPSTHQMGDEFKIWIGKNTDYDLETTFTIYKDWQLEESSSITTHEDHKSNILRTSEEIVLREVNGVQDTYNPLTGEYVKRIGEVVITSVVAKSVIVLNENVRVNITMSALNGDNGTTKANNTMSDKFYWSEANARDIEGLRVNGNTLHWCISRDKLTSQDLQGVNTWLQSNPITVQYELAEPITTIVEPLTIPFACENGHIILESGSEEQSLLPELKYSVPASKNGVLSTTSQAILKHEQRLHKLENLLLREAILMDYRLALSFLDKM